MKEAQETEKKKHYPFDENYIILTCRCPACDITFEAPAKRAISEDMFKGISCIECETANVNVIHSKGNIV